MAKKKEIVVRISPDGSKVEIDQEGMIGKECSENIKELVDKLGKVTDSKKKQEYYKKKKDVHINVQQ